jgi:hypothetical protein
MDEKRLAAALADRYRIVRPLGSGGMAVVYLAHDLKHDRDVALKVLRPELAAALGPERFLAEISISARLDHPHILTLIDSGSAEGFLFYVLPYVRGESLRARLDRERQLGVEEALAIARQVAAALDYAHRRGIVHRDVKPENILLHEGEAILTDFGIALAVQEAGGSRLTGTGISLGTPQYMSPEQATADRDLDARTDVYSLAAVLFEMLAGEPPVQGPTVQAIMARLLTERPERLRSLRDTVPEAVDRAVAKALSRTPADRPSTAAAFANALTGAGTTASAERAPLRWRSPYAVLAFAAVVIAAIAVAARRMVLSPPHPPLVALRDRTQLTFTGNVRLPAISADGRELAMVLSECHPRTCDYAIELQDVGEPSRRRVVQGAKAIYEADWSADGRYLLFTGRFDGRFGGFLVPALGGRPRLVSPYTASFYGADSLLILRGARASRVLIATRDGVVRDSFAVDVPGAIVQSVRDVPNSRWLIAWVLQGDEFEVATVDREGRVNDRFPVGRGGAISRVSKDGLWYAPGNERKSHIIRVPLDTGSGRFGSHHDTVYSGSIWGFDVTRDGGSIVLDEGAHDYGAWALPFETAIHGVLPEHAVRRSSGDFTALLSPDGARVLVSRGPLNSMDPAEAPAYSVMPFGGGPEEPLPFAGPAWAHWTDSVTLAVAEPRPDGASLTLLDVRTHRTHNTLQIPDPRPWKFAPLPDGGWAWLRPRGDGLAFQRRGDTMPNTLPQPDWYSLLMALVASPDGRSLVFAGFDAATNDSLRVEQLSLDASVTTPWITEPAEFGDLIPLSDGSFLFVRWEAQEQATLERLRGPGRVERLGTVPRPVRAFSVSGDLRRAVIGTYDYRGDIYMSRIIGR